MITQTYYISSGAKNAMYTLRVHRSGSANPNIWCMDIDFYICNLSTDQDKAEAKALEYFNKMNAHIEQTENFKLCYAGYADFDLNEREGKLSAKDTSLMGLSETTAFHSVRTLVRPLLKLMQRISFGSRIAFTKHPRN